MGATTHEESGRGVVPGRCVRVAGEATRLAVPRAGAALAEPRVELVRDGDIVRAIDITCACGQKIRVVCDYGGA